MPVLWDESGVAHKYRAKPTTVDGIRFASKLEARRYAELQLLQRAGTIANLDVHPVYPLHVGSTRIGKIIPDFRYTRDGIVIVEDTKSAPTTTALFKWKAKHLLAEHGVMVQIVKGRSL